MNSKMKTNNYKQLNLKYKNNIKQTSRTGTESQEWRSHGELSVRRGRGRMEGKGTGNKKHKL